MNNNFLSVSNNSQLSHSNPDLMGSPGSDIDLNALYSNKKSTLPNVPSSSLSSIMPNHVQQQPMAQQPQNGAAGWPTTENTTPVRSAPAAPGFETKPAAPEIMVTQDASSGKESKELRSFLRFFLNFQSFMLQITNQCPTLFILEQVCCLLIHLTPLTSLKREDWSMWILLPVSQSQVP